MIFLVENQGKLQGVLVENQGKYLILLSVKYFSTSVILVVPEQRKLSLPLLKLKRKSFSFLFTF